MVSSLLLTLAAVLGFAAAAATTSSPAPPKTIVPGAEWFDTDGNRIEAHGAGFLLDPNDGSYWWFGENAKTDDLTQHGVNCYHSTDLLAWQSHGQVFNEANITVPGWTGPVTIERPKVVYHNDSGQYVLWMHVDPNSYSLRRVGIAVASKPQGPYQFVRTFQPDNLPSLDMTVFVDTDDSGAMLGAYFVRSVDNAYVGISALTEDLMDTSGLISVIPTPREGHALFKHDGYYYMLTSHLTGWSSNPMEAWVSNKPTLHGAEWISLGNPTGSSTTFESQSAFVLPYYDQSSKQRYFIMMNDRWDYPNLLNASYIWLPITINSSNVLSIPWRDSWSLSGPFTTQSLSAPAAPITLSNELLTATFLADSGGLSSLQWHNWSESWDLLDERSTVFINGSDIQCTSVNSIMHNDTIVAALYGCLLKPYQLLVEYELRPQWNFVQKRLTVLGGSLYDTVSDVAHSLRFDASTVGNSRVVVNQQWNQYDHSVIVRQGNNAGDRALFAATQSPFGVWTVNHTDAAVTTTCAYQPVMPAKNSFNAPFTADGLVISPYQLSPYWHSNDNNYADVDAFTTAVTHFLQRGTSDQVRMTVGWDSNDYQMDISTAHGVEQYQRLLDRSAELGLNYVTFAPSNNAVSSRQNATDSWGWEEGLWLSLGEHIRTQQWIPGRDTVPPTVQHFLDYAASKDIKLLAYVYPPLGFRAQGDSAWLYGNDCCATLASVEFQHYFLDLLSQFIEVTGAGGFAWDYNGYGDPHHSVYAQYRGFHWILQGLRERFPALVMDFRQITHQEGAWSWIYGTHAEPLESDENPETYGVQIASLSTDHVAANVFRMTAYDYRVNAMAPNEVIPGFLGHQTERQFDNGTLAFSDNYIRDFDYMGFTYSLLSNMAGAPLNVVACMLPARDLLEYSLTASMVDTWRQWLDYGFQFAAERRLAIPIIGPVQQADVDGWVHATPDGYSGHLFLFNTGLQSRSVSIPMTEQTLVHRLPRNGTFLLKELYPIERNVRVFYYGDSLTLAMDGDSAAVYTFEPLRVTSEQPVVVGAKVGSVALSSDMKTLSFDGVTGEAGSTGPPLHAFFASAKIVSAIKTVTVNGQPTGFLPIDNEITTAQQMSFPGVSLPRSAQVGSVPDGFTGGKLTVPLVLTQELQSQLMARQAQFPIDWTDEELQTAWMAPHRLLLSINLIPMDESLIVSAVIDNTTVPIHKAYTSRHPVSRCFSGFFIDATEWLWNLTAAMQTFSLTVTFPTLKEGQLNGVFLQNVEPQLVLAGKSSTSVSSTNAAVEPSAPVVLTY